jgi:hypothetical protein
MERGELGKRKQQRRNKSLMLYLHTAAGVLVVCSAGTTQGWAREKNARNSN